LSFVAPSFSVKYLCCKITKISESDLDEEEVASAESGDDSDNSWTTPEEFSAEFILKQGSKWVLIFLLLMYIGSLKIYFVLQKRFT